MAIKKSDLYSSIWASCDALRGGMDASQYKDYVLFMVFIKYISDKYADSRDFEPPVVIPKGASFKDMLALKGKPGIGEKINTQVIAPLIDANPKHLARTDFPDFNDPNKLGEGQDMVDTLTSLIGIFQKPELDFSNNRAEHDDILGDAYEYLMRHFASESGKSKGQFYTPSEVIDEMLAGIETLQARLTELEEEHGGEEAVFSGFEPGVTEAGVKERIKEVDDADELQVLNEWLSQSKDLAAAKKRLRVAEAELDALALAKYPKLSEAEVKTLVIDDKWLTRLRSDMQGEVDRVAQTLTGRIRELAERYSTPLPRLTEEVAALSLRVDEHLKRMGFAWN